MVRREPFWSHRVKRRDLRVGDHLYVWSSILHHHHALYVGHCAERAGQPCVIHVYGDNKLQSRVQLNTLDEFARNRIVRRARYDRPWWELYVKAAGTVFDFPKDDAEQVARRAWEWLHADTEAHATVPEPRLASDTWAEVVRAAVRRGAVPANADEKQLLAVSDAAWRYNVVSRNCECFVLMCTAPAQSRGASHQAQLLTRFNPVATLLSGTVARYNHYRERRPEGFFSRLLQSAERRQFWQRVRRFGERTRSRFPRRR